ncbi:MAG: SAM-dependent methyltransferase, partial [Planctomycetota bacterium]
MKPSHPSADYELIDFGDGRKLESFAGRQVDRPSPAAESTGRALPNQWPQADSVFDPNTRTWRHRTEWPQDLTVDCGGFRMRVRPTPYGHVGLFPEQFPNWQWLQRPIDRSELPSQGQPQPWGLNLFGYTGASTCAMSQGGMAVAHVDAAKPNVSAAREAAQRNGMEDSAIRYLVDDAAKFAAREVRRGRVYQTIVLDP